MAATDSSGASRARGQFRFDDREGSENPTDIAGQIPEVVHALDAAIDRWLAEPGLRLPLMSQ